MGELDEKNNRSPHYECACGDGKHRRNMKKGMIAEVLKGIPLSLLGLFSKETELSRKFCVLSYLSSLWGILFSRHVNTCDGLFNLSAA